MFWDCGFVANVADLVKLLLVHACCYQAVNGLIAESAQAFAIEKLKKSLWNKTLDCGVLLAVSQLCRMSQCTLGSSLLSRPHASPLYASGHSISGI